MQKSLSKTEAAISPCMLCFLKTFVFSQIIELYSHNEDGLTDGRFSYYRPFIRKIPIAYIVTKVDLLILVCSLHITKVQF